MLKLFVSFYYYKAFPVLWIFLPCHSTHACKFFCLAILNLFRCFIFNKLVYDLKYGVV